MQPQRNAKLRAWWAHRQALDGRMAGAPPASVLAETGWARSVGGAGPYLTLFARAGTSRGQADAAAAQLAIHELPAARGCTYVVPACDFALALRAAASFPSSDLKTAQKLGVSAREIDKLCDGVIAALATGPLGPDEIRKATGSASRSLGEEGKKKGLTTTLLLALGRLQTEGEIRRLPVDGRLDRQRYRYAAWRPNPTAGCKLTANEIAVELARRFFRWTGPATLADFQWFSGLAVKAAKTALEPLRLTPLPDSGRLLLPGQRDEFDAFRVPKHPQYTLAAGLDGISLLRRDLPSLADDADRGHPLLAGGKGFVPDLPSHGIFDRGRLIGLWEYDPAAGAIAWTAFIPANRDLRAAVERTETYVREQLEDARSFSLDSPQSRIPRIQALRQLAAHP